MKLELELGTNELGNDLIDQFFVWKLKDVVNDMKLYAGHHPDDKKQNKKIAKACMTILEYYGASND